MRVIVTGVTGMVGEGVMHVCLEHPDVTEVLALGRRAYQGSHPKLTQLVHENLYDLSSVSDQLRNYDACFFCLGTTSVGKNEAEFTKVTYDLTMAVAGILSAENKGKMTFIYVSGAGTDSSEKGRIMWARVKGRTENDLRKLGFKQVFAYRPGYMHPIKGLRNTLPYYKYFTWMYPILKVITSNYVSRLYDVGLSMIHVTQKGYPKPVLEVKDINASASM